MRPEWWIVMVLSVVIAACSAPSSEPFPSTVGTTILTTSSVAPTTKALTDPTESISQLDYETSLVMGRADWSSGHVHAQIVHDLFAELGYEISDPSLNEYTPDVAYSKMADGEIDLWVNSWIPTHESWWEISRADGERVGDHVSSVGDIVPGGGLQGWLVTKSWAEANGVTTIDQIDDDPNLWSQLDSDGNGKAEIFGCPEEWTCDDMLTSQIVHSGWQHIEQVTGPFEETFGRFMTAVTDGEPAISYVWTPTVEFSRARVGESTMWVSIDDVQDQHNALGRDGGPDLNQVRGDEVGFTDLDADVCLGPDGTCQLGWLGNDIQATANRAWAANNPAAIALLDAVAFTHHEISDFLAAVEEQGGGDKAVRAVAAQWIGWNRDKVDAWLETAIAAA